MRKYFYFTAILAVFSVFGFYACNEQIEIANGGKSNDHFTQLSELIVGDFDPAGNITLYLTPVEMESVFTDFCNSMNYSNPIFIIGYIEDSIPSDTDYLANFVLRGQYTDANGV